MKKQLVILIAGSALALPAMAADSPHSFSANIGAVSDYIFRGVSQSQHDGALQGGVDYSHASGLYAGVWASTIRWVDAGRYKDDNAFEVDLYGGYKGSLSADAGYDLGAIVYYYPGDKVAGATTPDTTEIYAGLTWKFLSLKYNHVVSDYFVAWGGPGTKTKGSNYLDLTATHDLGGGWGLVGHIGRQSVRHDNVLNASYTDWKLGVSKDVGFGTVAVSYTGTDANKTAYTWSGEKVADGRLAVSFSKTF